MTDAAPTAAPAPAPSAAPAGGGDAAAPAPGAPAAAASSPPPTDGRAGRENRADRHARVLAKIDAKQAERSSAAPAAADAPPAGGEPAPATSAEPAKAEPAPVAPQDALTPAQQQAMRDAARAEREAWETKQELKRLREETAAAKAADEARKKMSDLELLAQRGTTYEQLTKNIVDGKYKELTAEQIALKASGDKVAELEARLKAFEDKDAATLKQKQLEDDAGKLNAELKQEQHAKRFPVLAAMPDAGRRILALKEQHADASYEDIAAHLENEARGLQSVDLLKARFAADANYKAQVMAALGLTQSPQPAQQVPQGKPRAGNGPDAISATRAADPGARSQPVKDGRAGRVATALAAANARQRTSLG